MCRTTGKHYALPACTPPFPGRYHQGVPHSGVPYQEELPYTLKWGFSAGCYMNSKGSSIPARNGLKSLQRLARNRRTLYCHTHTLFLIPTSAVFSTCITETGTPRISTLGDCVRCLQLSVPIRHKAEGKPANMVSTQVCIRSHKPHLSQVSLP